VNTPSNTKDPACWPTRPSRGWAGLPHVTVTVLGPEELRAGGFGGVLAVGGGSASPASRRGLATARSPGRRRATVVLVGKGITFDTADLDQAQRRDAEMKTDMAGGAAVLAAVDAAARARAAGRGHRRRPGRGERRLGSSYRPADVVRHVGGRTTEVLNTDAEGRMVLADGLAWARLELGPPCWSTSPR
jgi:leucyl aminopeptidase